MARPPPPPPIHSSRHLLPASLSFPLAVLALTLALTHTAQPAAAAATAPPTCFNGGAAVVNATAGAAPCTCASGFSGPRCELAQCAETAALRPGAMAEFYNGNGFSTRVSAQAVPQIVASWGGSPAGGVSSEYWSIHYTGLLLPFANGTYTVRCLTNSRSTCAVFVGGSQVADSTPLQLSSSQPTRFKVEFRYTRFGTNIDLQWKGPDTADAWASIAADSLRHRVTCDNGCGGRGCCIAENTCLCSAGFGGAQCDLDLRTCGGLSAPASGTAVLAFDTGVSVGFLFSLHSLIHTEIGILLGGGG